MSLGDYLRFLRAQRGGPPLQEVEASLGPQFNQDLREIEQRYSEVSEPGSLALLAEYYGVPLADLNWHRARSRKALGYHVLDAIQAGQAVTLHLRHGETVTGMPVWCDLGAIGLQPEGGQVRVIQRHAVIDWEGSPAEETPG